MKKLITLLSAGFDSPVAAYLMIKKSFKPIFLTFLTSDDKDRSMRNKVINIVLNLKNFTKNKVKLYIIKHDPNLDVFKRCTDRKLTCILCKRLMIRIAKCIGLIEGTNFIVTGDILGEQASQTINNLFAYNDLLKDFVLLRPLVGWDKLEVIKFNEKIRLYEICSQKSSSCQYNPQYPETNAKFFEVNYAESLFDSNNLINNSIKFAEILEL